MNPGDVVVLQSGSDRMTIESVRETVATCVWFRDSHVYREHIQFAALKQLPIPKNVLDQ
jgi:uncharacterized protein YodC (DUF2158 family)